MVEAPSRILLHPGFHKTGTSSIQHFLWTNRQRLKPHAELLMLRHLKPVVKLCAAYSRTHNPLYLADMAGEFLTALQALPPLADRALLVSCEGLSGHLPGWPEVGDFTAAPISIAAALSCLTETYPQARAEVVLTTRARAPWLDSVWRHHLAGQRMVLDRAEFARRHAAASDLTALATEVAEAVAPVPVRALPLEEAALHPKGPGGALCELLPLPPGTLDGFEPVGHGNRGPDRALAAELLALNRAEMPGPERRAAKDRLLAEAGIAGWVEAAQNPPEKPADKPT